MAYSIGFDIFARDKASAAFDKLGKKVGETESKFTKHSTAFKLAAAGAGAAVVKFASDAITGASDIAESTSKVGVVFGKYSTQIITASDSSAKSMGLSKAAYLEAAGTLGNLLVSLKIAPAAAAGMSQSMVKLAGDMASFNNVSPEEAMIALKAGLVGETEPLRQFGVNMNDATLRAQALKMHLIKSTKDALSPQTKALAAQALIMAQTGTAQGDFAKTSTGLANQQRIVTARFSDLQATIGTKLIPVMSKAVEVGIKVMDWMSKNQPVALSIAGAIGVLTVAQWAMNSALLANPIGLVVVALVALGVGLVMAYQKSETFRSIVDGAFRGIAAAATWMWNVVLQPVIALIIKGYGLVFHAIGTVLTALGNVPGFGWAKTAGAMMTTAGDAADRLAGKINKIPDNKTVKVNMWVDSAFSKSGIDPKTHLPVGFSRGGTVPGVGSDDTEPAMLTPGEFVVRRDGSNIGAAVALFGVGAGRSQGSGGSGGGGTVINLHVNGPVYGSTTDLAAHVLAGLQRLKGSGTNLGLA